MEKCGAWRVESEVLCCFVPNITTRRAPQFDLRGKLWYNNSRFDERGGKMKRILSLFLAFLMLFSVCTIGISNSFAESKTYAEDKLIEIEKTTGFIPGKNAAVLYNCYGFVSAVCEKLFGVGYNGEGLYSNYKAKHASGNYYTVATFETANKTPTSADVENIISFFVKYAAPGDVVHYGAYNTGVNKTHTFMVQSISDKKLSILHSNYNVPPYDRASCHIDDIYWDSFRKNPTQTERNSDGSLYSLNAMFYSTMKAGGVGITINRYSKYESKYYLVGAAIPTISTERSSTNSIKVSWDEIIGATKYKLQYKESGASKYITASEGITSLSYDVKYLTVGKKYDFRVAAYIGSKWMNYSDVATKQVLPPTLTVIKFTPESNGLTLSWTKRSDITGIRIYKSESSSKDFSKIKTITDNSTGTYLDKKITYGKTYYYKIERYIKTDNGEYSTTSKAISGAYTLQKPEVTYRNIHSTEVEVSLSAKGKNDTFNYYVTDSKNKNFIPLTKTTDNTVIIKNLTAGASYNFYCRQSTSLGSGDYTEIKFTAIPKQESITSVAASAKGIVVSYSPCSDVDGYMIYRSLDKNGIYALAGCVDDEKLGKFTDIDVAYNTEYYYKVKSFVKSGSNLVYSEYSFPSRAIKVTVAKPEELNVTRKTPTSMTVKWKAVKNANKYIVQYKAEGDKKWSEAAATSSTSKVISKLTLGVNYTFRVKAANDIGSGSYSAQISKKALPPTPGAPTLKNKSTGIRVSWTAKDYASGYNIYRATSENGTYTLVKTISNPETSSWTDKNVGKNKTYYYKTVCFVTKKGKTYNSPKSKASSIKHSI